MSRLWSFLPERLWLRRSLQGLILLALLLLLLIGIARVIAKTSFAHSFVEARVEALTLSGQQFEIEGLRGDLLGAFSAGHIRVRDEQGVWLSAQDVELDWSPLLLVGGGLHMKAAEVSELTVSRRPELVSSEASSSDGGGWISRYRLQSLSIPALQIAEPVFGPAVAASVSASVDTNIRTGRAALTLTPENAGNDRVDGVLSWGGSVPFAGRIEATGPETGLIAGLLGAQENGPVDLVLEADGDRADWQADGYLNLGNARYVTLTAERARESLSADLSADLSAFERAAPIRDRFGADVTARFEASGSDPARLQIDATDTWLEARAPFDGQSLRLDLTAVDIVVESRSPALIGLNELTYRSLIADGEVGLNGSQIRFDGNIVGDALSYAGAEEQIEAYIGDALKVDLDLTLNTQNQTLELRSVELSPRVGGITLAGLTSLSAADFGFEGTFSPNPAAAIIPETITLSPISFSAERSGAGSIEVQTQGDAELAAGIDGLWLTGPFDIQTDILIDPSGRIEARSIDLTGAYLSAAASGAFESGALNVDLTANAQAGELGGLAIEGLAIEAAIIGALDDLAIAVAAEPRGLIASGYGIDEPSLTFDGRRVGNRFEGDLVVRARHRGEALALDTGIFQDGGLWGLSNFEADLFGLTAVGAASGNGASLADLTADLRLSGAPTLLPQVGQVDGRVELSGETAFADLTFEQISTDAVTFKQVRLSANGTRYEVSGALNLDGDVELGDRTMPLQAASNYTLRPFAGELDFDLDGSIDSVAVQSVQPISLRRSGEEMSVNAELSTLGGFVKVDGSQSLTGLDLDAEIVDLALADLAVLAGRERLTGQINGSFRLSGEGKDLTGEGRLDLKQISQTGSGLAPTDIAATLTLLGNSLQLSGTVENSEDAINLTAQGEIPMRARAAPFELAPQTDAPAQFELQGEGRVEALWSLFGPADMRFEGGFDLAANAEGPLSALRPRGEIALNEAVFEDGVVGLRLKEIDLAAVMMPDGVRVNSVSAAGAKGGTVTGSGVYAFDGSGDVDLQLDGLNALQRSDATAIISGDLSVRREDETAQVTGDLIFDRAEINIDRLPGGGFTTLDVRWPERGDVEREPEEETLPVFLDIGLRGDRRIFVTGQSLSSEWALKARVTGAVRAPDIVGTARIVRGDVDVVGQEFRFVDSSIRFNGNPVEAALSMRAERDADDLLAYFSVTGTPLAPEFSLGSDPALPDDEVLSRVLFGVSPSQLSGFQAAQLAGAVASFAGGGSGLDLIGSLEDALDVDRLDFGVAEDGATSIGAGKYVAEDVYVELRTGTRGAPGLGVEWTPRRNVEIGAELGSEAAPRFTVQWKRDFDFDRDDEGVEETKSDTEE